MSKILIQYTYSHPILSNTGLVALGDQMVVDWTLPIVDTRNFALVKSAG